MRVRDGMSEVVLTVGPGHTLRAAAAAMCARQVGAAIVLDPDAQGPGVITERDILESVGRGQDPDRERVAEHLTGTLAFAAPRGRVRAPRCGRGRPTGEPLSRVTREAPRRRVACRGSTSPW